MTYFCLLLLASTLVTFSWNGLVALSPSWTIAWPLLMMYWCMAAALSTLVASALGGANFATLYASFIICSLVGPVRGCLLLGSCTGAIMMSSPASSVSISAMSMGTRDEQQRTIRFL